MADVEVILAQDKAVIANLMQLYIHDFSEYWSGLPRGEIGGDGRFEDYPLDPWWEAADHIPLLFRTGGRLAGFALLNAASHSGLPVDRNVAEFFVLRKHRGAGLGAQAAHVIFSRWPGQWEAAVARRNVKALPFWRRTARGHPGVSDVEELDRADPRWNGPIVRFRVSRASGAAGLSVL